MVADGIMDSMVIRTNASLTAPSAESGAQVSDISLPAALLTGHKLIDFDHHQLLASMASTRAACIDLRARADCSGCTVDRRGLCEKELVCLLGDLLSFILDHFKTEEEIMRDSLLMMLDRDVCEAHIEDHAAISAKVQEIVSRLDTIHTVGLLRDLDSLLEQWICNHIALHDTILARWVSREGAALGMVRNAVV